MMLVRVGKRRRGRVGFGRVGLFGLGCMVCGLLSMPRERLASFGGLFLVCLAVAGCPGPGGGCCPGCPFVVGHS